MTVSEAKMNITHNYKLSHLWSCRQTGRTISGYPLRIAYSLLYCLKRPSIVVHCHDLVKCPCRGEKVGGSMSPWRWQDWKLKVSMDMRRLEVQCLCGGEKVGGWMSFWRWEGWKPNVFVEVRRLGVGGWMSFSRWEGWRLNVSVHVRRFGAQCLCAREKVICHCGG